MADQDTLPQKKAQKFFFDLHDFSPEAIQKTLEATRTPPPPSFSEKELKEAKDKSFAEGRKDGLEEATRQRERYVADLMTTVTENLSALFQEEGHRLALYEEETIQLTLTIFRKLFPALNKAGGLEEVEHIISNVLKSQKSCPEIIIEVQPDYVAHIRAKVDGALETIHNAGECAIKANESLADGDCRLFWDEGGAVRDHVFLTQEIEKHLQEILAEEASVPDNRDEEIRSDGMTDDKLGMVDDQQPTRSEDGDK